MATVQDGQHTLPLLGGEDVDVGGSSLSPGLARRQGHTLSWSPIPAEGTSEEGTWGSPAGEAPKKVTVLLAVRCGQETSTRSEEERVEGQNSQTEK